ncbi:MAG: glycosyltransferase family 4 protein [Cyanobacteria bacterium P01_D01_bin.116]
MRIAQVAPLRERVPPPSYGGIELVVSHLSDELVRRGHEVTLFASGDSLTLAELEPMCEKALRLDPNVTNCDAYELLELSQVYQRAAEFDLIHSHLGVFTLATAGLVATPTVHTLHHSFNADTSKIYTHHNKQPYISISDAQRKIDLNYVGTVYNGIDENSYPFIVEPENPPYLAFLGRLAPEKGPAHAISIAKQTGWCLKMAGKIDKVDRKFFDQEIAPHIDGKQIQYLGEVNHEEKAKLLGNAAATLFPITWQEPFGLVMIESMATGTPVIATNMGSVPEVINHGITGFICQSPEDMASLIPEALELSRYSCRKHVEDKFTVSKMVDGYEAIYRKTLENRIQKNGFIHSAKIKC